jgi:hypothetical protein
VTAIPVASVDEKNRKVALEIKIQESGASQQVPYVLQSGVITH